MDKEIEIQIDDEGNLQSIYDDQLNDLYKSLGAVRVERASDVEWEDKGWTVRCHKNPGKALRWVNEHIKVSCNGNIVHFESREEALKYEVKNFWELIGETK